MVRRRGPKKGPKAGPRPVDRKDGKMKRWNTVEDIPMDEEEEFHANKDRILLDGGEYQGDDDGDEEEVFALKGIPASDSDDEGEDQYEDEEEDMADVELPAPSKSSKKAKTKAKARAKAEISESEEEEEEEEESWGRSKAAYYSSNAAELESSDEEMNELEEQEARRLQAKARDVMTEDDFGLGDVAAVVDQEDIIEDPIEPPPKVDTRPLPTDRKSIIRHLEKTSPETLALAADWEDVAAKLVSSQGRLKQLEANEPDALSRGMAHLHYQTLLTYATTLAFYLHLRTSDKYAARPEQLRAHPIFGRLLQLKQALSTLEELDFDLSASDADALSDEDPDEPAFLDGAELGSFKLSGKRMQLDFEDLAQLLREAEEDLPAGLPTPSPKKKSKSKSKTTDAAPPPKKRKLAASAPPPIFDLAEPAFVPSAPSKRTTRSTDAADAFGDAQTLGAADAADKSARKKSLRFHTAQIAGTSARRAGARAALGGDDDVPYRERRREREARRLREAAAGGLGLGGADLDAAEPAQKRAREDDAESGSGSGSGEEDEGGYYSLVKKSKTARKEAKQAEYDAVKAAARPDVVDDSAAGPRSLTRAILKNRGLTPHRAKSVRNPRVKKRQKFDKAKKVLASQKAVYKGPGDATRYAGEQSGISKVVKSVRF